MDGVLDDRTGMATEEVVLNTVVFARSIGGVPVIQPACFIHRVHHQIVEPALNAVDSEDGLLTSAKVYAIPAARVVEPDVRWPEAMQLCQNAPGCGRRPVIPDEPEGSQ